MGNRILKAFDGYMTLDESQTSDDISIGHHARCAVQVVVDNTDAVGEISIQGSCNRSNWVDLNYEDVNGDLQDGYDVTSGADVNHVFDTDTALPWLRVRYVRTSGTGGLNFYIHTKV